MLLQRSRSRLEVSPWSALAITGLCLGVACLGACSDSDASTDTGGPSGHGSSPNAGSPNEASADPSSGTTPGPAHAGSATDRDPGQDADSPAGFVDPRVLALRGAIDRGDLVQAGPLRAQADALLSPVDRALLDARLALLIEDDIFMEQSLAEARALAPEDPRVLATAIEVHAWRGMADTATQELANAMAQYHGALLPPELMRAEGIVDICTERMSRVGLKHLQDARAARPDLPFCDRALSQAHMLVGKSHAGTDRRTALEHAMQAAEFDPADPDVRVFLADMLMMNGEWGAGLQVFEEAIAAGENLGPELANHYQKAGIVALGQGKRDIAIEYFLRARELGMPDAELRTGLQVLIDEAIVHVTQARIARETKDWDTWEAELVQAAAFQPGLHEIALERSEACADRALAALIEQDLEGAIVHFEAALGHDPNSLFVRHSLATVHFEQGDFEAAADQWYEVVDLARLEKAPLPEPVHIRLAEALGRCGRMQEGRQVLMAYLDLEPLGEYVDLTRQLLRELPPPPEQGSEPEGDSAGGGPQGSGQETDLDSGEPDTDGGTPKPAPPIQDGAGSGSPRSNGDDHAGGR